MSVRFKILHIHTHLKFVKNSRIFDCSYFENKTVILTENIKLQVNPDLASVFCIKNHRDITRILSLCTSYDIVVFYQLDLPKSYLINRLPKSCVVIWRFFGDELYKKIPGIIYSELTLEYNKKRKEAFFERTRSVFRQMIKYHTVYKIEFEKAIKRVNYFLGLCENEYEFLKSFFPYLPPFIQHPYYPIIINPIDNLTKENLIIIGNNRSPYNNHPDIFEMIKKSEARKNYSFLVFYNYGLENNYTRLVKDIAAEIEEIKLVEDFLSVDEFQSKYFKASAFVMNGYRQMAMNNILCAIECGVKIYLNKRNTTYHFLKNEGFIVSSVEDFIDDLDSGKISLTQDEVRKNISCFGDLVEKYSIENFREKLYINCLS